MSELTALSISWNLEPSISVDYLLSKPDMLKLTDAPTPVYYGLGARLGTQTGSNDDPEETSEIDLSVRGVIGISYYLSAYPMDIFIESTPSIALLGGGGFDFGGSFGFRYFF